MCLHTSKQTTRVRGSNLPAIPITEVATNPRLLKSKCKIQNLATAKRPQRWVECRSDSVADDEQERDGSHHFLCVSVSIS